MLPLSFSEKEKLGELTEEIVNLNGYDYPLVWAKKVTLAAICLDISSARFGIRIN
jgi:hypothetical protein